MSCRIESLSERDSSRCIALFTCGSDMCDRTSSPEPRRRRARRAYSTGDHAGTWENVGEIIRCIGPRKRGQAQAAGVGAGATLNRHHLQWLIVSIRHGENATQLAGVARAVLCVRVLEVRALGQAWRVGGFTCTRSAWARARACSWASSISSAIRRAGEGKRGEAGEPAQLHGAGSSAQKQSVAAPRCAARSVGRSVGGSARERLYVSRSDAGSRSCLTMVLLRNAHAVTFGDTNGHTTCVVPGLQWLRLETVHGW